MPTDAEIIAAKRVLRNAGYYCIPREKVLRVGGRAPVDERAWHEHSDDPSFIRAVRADIARAMAMEIVKNANAVEWTTEPGSMPRSTDVVGLVSMLTVADAEDPVVAMIRESQEAR